jgi:glycosyltransferase involved in cell wall biosynthesis
MSSDELRDRRCVILAATSHGAAENFARRAEIPDPLILSRHELIESLRSIRRRVRSRRIEVALIHSAHWRNETAPQFYQLVALALPVRSRYLADEAEDSLTRLSRARLTVKASALPATLGLGLIGAGREVARAAIQPRRTQFQFSNGRVHQPAVLAIWLATPGALVGGSVTHISGILKGFRSRGFRIGLVCQCFPPPQLREVVDEIEVCGALPEYARVTADLAQLAMNRAVRQAAAVVARRLPPTMIYQRHAPFLVAGLDVMRATGAPLVLEWNGSEAWIRQNWGAQIAIERVFVSPLNVMEGRAVRSAQLVVSISEHAAAMALEAGAAPERVVVVPNGVDLEDIDRATSYCPPARGSGPVIGWIGSFGPWHGAEVLIRALALLPADVRLVMVGDGLERRRCQALAAELGVADQIAWTGALAHREALRELSSCDLLASPHVPLADQPFFGSPTKLFEYMGLGKPIVASRLEQLGEMLEDGQTAVLVEPGDPDALAAGVRRVLESHDRGLALGRAARARAEAEHTWEHRAEAIIRRLSVQVRRQTVNRVERASLSSSCVE